MTLVNEHKGFTLIELLIGMSLALVVMAGIYSIYYTQQKSYLAQEQVAAMEQNLRAALYHLESDIRMAGCDPTRSAHGGIETACNDQISFTEDSDGDRTNTTITYSLATATRQLVKNGSVIADGIELINFVYLDADDNDLNNKGMADIADPAVIEQIRSVEVSVVAKTQLPDPTYTDATFFYNQRDLFNAILNAQNDHFRRRMLTTIIKCRNLWL